MKVLWLASWYPNEQEPVNGDFIQRHAKAVSHLQPIDVMHVVQLGHQITTSASETVTADGPLLEIISTFAFRPVGFSLIDKLRYNAWYLAYFKQQVLAYEKKYGRPDIIHVHVPIKAGIIGRWAAKRWNIPYIISEQASYYEQAAPDNFHTRSSFFRNNARKIFRDAAVVTNVSATIGQVIQQLFQLKKVVPVHNLAETDFFHYTTPPHNKLFTWLHVSALGEQKNIRGMLAAFAAMKDDASWQLRIAGPYTKQHIDWVAEYGLASRVSFTGELAYEDVAKEMQQADAFVLFSNHENFPCVVVEALCCGLPVVAADAGGVREAIHAGNGIVVQPQQEAQLTEALKKVSTHYTMYDRARISRAAAERYAAPVIAQQFVDIYRQLTQKSST